MGLWQHFQNSSKSFFRGGVHPEEHKELTSGFPICTLPTPPKVFLHLNQNIGSPAVAKVKRGDIVLRGQMVAEGGLDSVPVHSPVYGKVTNVGKATHPSLVEGQAVIIEALPTPSAGEDGKVPPTELPWTEDPQWLNLSKEEMLERIKVAGLVGLGGAAFPTYRKLNLPTDAKVDTLIINGAECEPYLTSDHRLMLEQSFSVIYGSWLIAKIIQVRKIYIGIEDNKMDAVSLLQEMVKELKLNQEPTHPVEIIVQATRTRYPQGSEKQLIEALVNRTVPPRKLPMHVGVVVQNVATAAAVYDAVRFRKPLMDRIVTVTGLGIEQPNNLLVPLGTSLEEIVRFCGGIKSNTVKILNGGPMMGRTLPTVDVPVIKGTNGFVFMTEAETYLGRYEPCIQCGRCLDVCPLGLEPQKISMFVEAGQPLQTATYGTHECFECGCCTYTCPSKRPLVQFIQVAKSAYRKDQQIKRMQQEKGGRNG